MSSDQTFSWGAQALSRGEGVPRHAEPLARRQSLLGARMAATIIDGLVLVVPLVAVDFLLSRAFPNHGFFFTRSGAAISGSTGSSYKLPLPGLLVLSALSLSYFFVCEARSGRTVGKRAMGVRVRSVSGGRAGLNAVSARTVLRLIDALPSLYLLGALVALLTGSRRRRVGDWAGRTVVVHDVGEIFDDAPARSDWRIALYPLGWTAAILIAIFAAGLGTAAGDEEAAVALVRSYVAAREQGNASLACSMLSTEQQRELVAIESNDYVTATAAECPTYILRSDPSSHLLNPALHQLATGPLDTRYVQGGAVIIGSPDTSLQLVAVTQNNRLKLDVRGIERLAFINACTSAGSTPSVCECIFGLLRAQDALPEGPLTLAESRTIAQDASRCRTAATE